eukprot:TRINITY_DN36763_c0_g1_i1.p2 TRINITY_DN36763_c0_g1~~TRINITY_DN36763_c0_g1_i1.p2  ORF type:complete len:119 (-),score=37.87 TRINITY_DN36763_c0_g1_i1:152-508(-)
MLKALNVKNKATPTAPSKAPLKAGNASSSGGGGNANNASAASGSKPTKPVLPPAPKEMQEEDKKLTDQIKSTELAMEALNASPEPCQQNLAALQTTLDQLTRKRQELRPLQSRREHIK